MYTFCRELEPTDKNKIIGCIQNECGKASCVAGNLLYAPEACCMVEILTVLAGCAKDPSLRSGDKDEQFLFLRTPGSFKASLYQVITSMCNAFRTAHNSMHKIHMNLEDIPEFMHDLLQAINEVS